MFISVFLSLEQRKKEVIKQQQDYYNSLPDPGNWQFNKLLKF